MAKRNFIEEALPLLTKADMSIIAMKYMGFNLKDVEKKWENDSDVEGFCRKLLNDWNRQSHQTNDEKKLGYILYDSGLVDRHEVEKKFPIRDKKDTAKKVSRDTILAELACGIAKSDMESIALGQLGESYTWIQNNKKTQAWLFNIQTLVQYVDKEKNMQTLRDILTDSGRIDPSVLDKFKSDLRALKSGDGASEATSTTVVSSAPAHPADDQPDAPSSGVLSPGTIVDDDFYDMSSDTPGYVLIIDNRNFGSHCNPREGSDDNCAKLNKLFSDRGFKVIEQIDLSSKLMMAVAKAFVRCDDITMENKENFLKQFQLTKDDVDEMCQEPSLGKTYMLNAEDRKDLENGKYKYKDTYRLKNEDVQKLRSAIRKIQSTVKSLKSTKSLIVIVMSHGKNGTVLGVDGNEINLDDFFLEFSADNCRAMAGKPKLFLIQGCRGDKEDTKFDSLGKNFDWATIGTEVIPRSADMITGFATTAGLVAERFVLTEKFCEVVEEYGDTTDVLSLSTKVNKAVAQSLKECDHKQISEFRTTLQKKWKLPPKQK